MNDFAAPEAPRVRVCSGERIEVLEITRGTVAEELRALADYVEITEAQFVDVRTHFEDDMEFYLTAMVTY